MKTTIRASLSFAAAIAAIAAVLSTIHSGKTSAGIQGSGFRAAVAIGPITATDPDITVGDTGYDTSLATIIVNGRSASRAQLNLGQIVSVHGGVDTSGNSGVASTIEFTADVDGPITKVDGASHTLQVLGQTVLTTPATIYGSGSSVGGGSTLAVGTNVQVSAFPDGGGKLVASRIDVTVPGPEQQVRGQVRQLDAAAHSFRINNLSIDCRGMPPVLGLLNGAWVTVLGAASTDGSQMYATEIRLSPPAAALPGVQGRIEGIITAFESNSSFSVDGLRVVTNSGTHFILHGQALAQNVRTSVQGSFDLSGTLVAAKVQVVPDGH